MGELIETLYIRYQRLAIEPDDCIANGSPQGELEEWITG